MSTFIDWHEEVLEEKEIHEANIEKFGQADSKRKDRGGTGWSLKDTAEQLNISVGKLCQDIKLAEAFKAHPFLLRIKDKQVALRVATTPSLRNFAGELPEMPVFKMKILLTYQKLVDCDAIDLILNELELRQESEKI